MFATLVHGRQHDHKVSTVCIEKQPQRQRQVVRVPDWVEHNRSQVLSSRWIDQLSFHLFHKNQCMSPLIHNVKRNWHLICPPRLLGQSRFKPCLRPGYFLLRCTDCMMETCMLLAEMSVLEQVCPQ